jgi:hypothetical protein
MLNETNVSVSAAASCFSRGAAMGRRGRLVSVVMKKQGRATLVVTRETMRPLGAGRLAAVVGGTPPADSRCEACLPKPPGPL